MGTRDSFADTRIPVESYRGLVAEVDGPDPDDNAHMAAAVAGQVESLVTWNNKDFDCGFTRKHTIKIVDPDQYLWAIYEEFPDEQRKRRRSPAPHAPSCGLGGPTRRDGPGWVCQAGQITAYRMDVQDSITDLADP